MFPECSLSISSKFPDRATSTPGQCSGHRSPNDDQSLIGIGTGGEMLAEAEPTLPSQREADRSIHSGGGVAPPLVSGDGSRWAGLATWLPDDDEASASPERGFGEEGAAGGVQTPADRAGEASERAHPDGAWPHDHPSDGAWPHTAPPARGTPGPGLEGTPCQDTAAPFSQETDADATPNYRPAVEGTTGDRFPASTYMNAREVHTPPPMSYCSCSTVLYRTLTGL
jgi:hypothetical protein